MFVPLWLLGVIALAFLVLARLALARRSGGDMIESQRLQSGATPAPPSPPPPATPEEAALRARPDVAAALLAGSKIEAIKAVREATGLGLKESKELVERWERG